MSRVTITDLVPGTEATSTDVNATINSWNTAAAAGAIGANNFRQEGIDRRSLSFEEQAIQSDQPGPYADLYYENSGSSGAVTGAAYAVITLAGADMIVGNATGASSITGAKKVIRASVTFLADVSTLVECVIQTASTAAGPWTTQSNTYQAFETIEIILASSAPLCASTYTSCVSETPADGNRFARVAFKASPGNVTFEYGTLYIEEYAH